MIMINITRSNNMKTIFSTYIYVFFIWWYELFLEENWMSFLMEQNSCQAIFLIYSPVHRIHRGIACLDVPDFKTTGQVSIVPVVTSFSPVEGSLEGGTVVTIQGKIWSPPLFIYPSVGLFIYSPSLSFSFPLSLSLSLAEIKMKLFLTMDIVAFLLYLPYFYYYTSPAIS